MKISELIKDLKIMQEMVGDVEVHITDHRNGRIRTIAGVSETNVVGEVDLIHLSEEDNELYEEMSRILTTALEETKLLSVSKLFDEYFHKAEDPKNLEILFGI